MTILNEINSKDNQFVEQVEIFDCPVQLSNSEFDDATQAEFQRLIDQLIERRGLVGISAAVVTDDGKTWTGVAGKSSDMPNDTIYSEMVFAMGSVTKTITAAAILQLMEAGELTLEDPLSMYIPNYANIDSTITIHQLLQHTSGIYNITENPDLQTAVFLAGDKIWSPDEVLKTFVKSPLFPKGTSWSYSNTNFIILGLIIEEITGLDYHRFVRLAILEPSGLSSMSLFPYEQLRSDLPHLWTDLLQTGKSEDAILKGLKLEGLFSAAWSAGAYTSTSEDIAKWMSILQNSLFNNPSTINKMRDSYVLGQNTGYGLGLVIINLPDATFYGHAGDIGYSTQAYYSPEKGVSLVLNTNDGIGGSASLTNTIFDLYNAYCSSLSSSTNIDKSNDDFNINISSSSSENYFNINSNKTIHQYMIYNLQGTAASNLVTIDRNNFELNIPRTNKMYLIKFISKDHQIYTKKIIKSY